MQRDNAERERAMVQPPIDGSTILLTGASSGIGRELARQLAHRARTLILVARRADRLEELREELEPFRVGIGLASTRASCSHQSHLSLKFSCKCALLLVGAVGLEPTLYGF